MQELHPPPGRDGGAEHAVREDPVLDGPPAPELVQELDETGRFAGFHGEEPVRVGLEGVLDLVPRETKAVEFLEEAAQAVGVGDAAEEGGGLGGGDSGGAVEKAVQAAGGLWVFLALRGWGGGGGVGEDALNAEELAEDGR